MVKKKEFRQTYDFPPSLLYKQDLLELENIFTDSKEHTNDKTRIQLIHKDEHFEANSLQDLFAYQNLPASVDTFTIDRKGWIKINGQNEIDRGIHLSMAHNHISCQIYAYDEDWYRGKLERIRTFFKQRKPWYSLLNKISPAFLGISIIPLLYSLYLLKSQNYFLSIAPSILFVFLLFAFILVYQQKIFPYVKIVLKEKTKLKIGFNEISTVIITIAAIFTIIQFIYSLW